MNRKSQSLLLLLTLVAAPALTGRALAQAQDDEALWKTLDRNESGWLSGNELNGGWVKYDADADGEVTKAEFLAGRGAETAASQPNRGGRATNERDRVMDAALFLKLDTSGEGYLDGGELTASTFKRYDINADGRVVLAEFAAGRARDRLEGTTAVPPTAVPPTAVPPTAVPPTAAPTGGATATPVRPSPPTAPNPATVPPKSGPVVRYRPPAAAPDKAAEAAGAAPRAGKYRILGTGGRFLLQLGYFVLSGGNQYRVYDMNMKTRPEAAGRYRFDSASQSVVWLTGPYKEAGWGGFFQTSFQGAKHSIIINRAVTAENVKE